MFTINSIYVPNTIRLNLYSTDSDLIAAKIIDDWAKTSLELTINPLDFILAIQDLFPEGIPAKAKPILPAMYLGAEAFSPEDR